MQLTLENSNKRFSEKFKDSGKLTEQFKGIIPGGFSRKTVTYGPHLIFIDHGEGQYIYTVEGHRLLDLHNNFSVNTLGHNHPKISSALMEAIPKGYSYGSPMTHESKLAEIICSRVESVERIKFSCSASEACLSAARIARANTGKQKIAKFEGGYHGFIDDFQISTRPSPDSYPGPDHHPLPVATSAGIPSYVTENTIILPQNDLESCEKILRESAGDTACVFMELQSGAGGVVVLDREFVKGIRALTEELGILLVLDETITLRADYHGMQSLYGIKPDLTVMGKIIGGGLPLGAVGGQAKYFEMCENGQVSIAGTHHANSLTIVAGIACLESMDEAAYDRLNTLADRIKDELNEWAIKEEYPFVVYGEFSVLGYTFTDEVGREPKNHRDFWKFVNSDHVLIYNLEMATRGYLPLHLGELCLSLPMTDEDIDSFIETSKEVVEGIVKA